MNVRSVNMKNRRAPLAEFESTRVENSPAVELPPIGFDRLTSSPGQRRRAQQTITATAAATTATKILPPTTTTTFMHDSNGNVISVDVTTTNLSGLFHYFLTTFFLYIYIFGRTFSSSMISINVI